MKFVSKNTLLAAMLAAASVSAFAADSVDLKIVGTIVPPSCTPALTGGGVVDFGNIPAASLSQTSFNKIGSKSMTLSVTCDSPTLLAIKAIDGRAGTAVAGGALYSDGYVFPDSMGFGLGAVGGKNVGTYILGVTNTQSGDGTVVQHMRSDDGGSTWVRTGQVIDTLMKADGSRIQSWGPALTPTAYTTVSQTFNVLATINKAANLPALNQAVPLDGMATFSLVYL
ncbi:DUF1120 domain-containing protein [Paraburkholderia sp. GAS334]|uniref:DUF1120 domain-containing protein n=1 Tax=Paraburkholderia sp. GAS334 TaxID=3035131 RepID=UPI003D204C12